MGEASAAGLNDVLKEAGVPKGSFYRWFSSRDAFRTALMESYFHAYLADMDRMFTEPNRSSAERLMRYWQHWRETHSTDDCQGRCLAVKLGTEVADLSESMRKELEADTTAIVDRLERMITAGVADGSLSIDDTARTTAEVLYDAWLEASVMAKIHRRPDPLDRAMTVTRQTLHQQL